MFARHPGSNLNKIKSTTRYLVTQQAWKVARPSIDSSVDESSRQVRGWPHSGQVRALPSYLSWRTTKVLASCRCRQFTCQTNTPKSGISSTGRLASNNANTRPSQRPISRSGIGRSIDRDAADLFPRSPILAPSTIARGCLRVALSFNSVASRAGRRKPGVHT